jgi:NAD(P)-dependent dehydrogenase (short-subunit alcohol dehydrogenase family)
VGESGEDLFPVDPVLGEVDLWVPKTCALAVPVHERAARRHGPPGAGVIINNTSVSGIRNPNKGLALYSASKAAAISLTRSAALEYASCGVRVNAIAPGRVVTGMMLNSKIADMASVARSLPLGRMGNPVGIANLVTWLATDATSYVVGQTIGADGGFLAS